MNNIRKRFFTLLCVVGCGICFAVDTCTNCGKPVHPGDNYCMNCGAYIPYMSHNTSNSYKAQYDPSASSESQSQFWTPLKLSIAWPLALPSGKGCDVYGLHIALLGGTCNDMGGLGVAGLYFGCKKLKGVSFSAFANTADCVDSGAQVGFINAATELHGLQIGYMNFADKCPCGLQIGFLNVISDNNVPLVPIINGSF